MSIVATDSGRGATMEYKRLTLGLIALALTAASAAAQGVTQPAPVKSTHPKFLSGPEAEFPDAAKAAGEFGKVIVSGTIDVDGRLHDAKVEVSSKSALLDASALAAANAAVFEPAHNEQGAAIAKLVQIPYDFSNAKTPGPGGGALRYRCDQFVRDYDWWFKTWPADKHDDFYFSVLGYETIARINGGNLQALGEETKNFDAHWRATVEDCRKNPDKLFIDVIEPEGPFLRRLAGG